MSSPEISLKKNFAAKVSDTFAENHNIHQGSKCLTPAAKFDFPQRGQSFFFSLKMIFSPEKTVLNKREKRLTLMIILAL